MIPWNVLLVIIEVKHSPDSTGSFGPRILLSEMDIFSRVFVVVTIVYKFMLNRRSTPLVVLSVRSLDGTGTRGLTSPSGDRSGRVVHYEAHELRFDHLRPVCLAGVCDV